MDGDGRMQAPVGGGAGVFGISGTNDSALFNPGVMNGSLTQIQLIGPETSNPNTQLYKRTTIISVRPSASPGPSGRRPALVYRRQGQNRIRSGYGISYIRPALYSIHMYNSYEPDALSTTVTETSTSLLNLNTVKIPDPDHGYPPVHRASQRAAVAGAVFVPEQSGDPLHAEFQLHHPAGALLHHFPERGLRGQRGRQAPAHLGRE